MMVRRGLLVHHVLLVEEVDKMPHKKPGIAIVIAVKPSKKDTKKKYAGNAMPNNAMNKAWDVLKIRR